MKEVIQYQTPIYNFNADRENLIDLCTPGETLPAAPLCGVAIFAVLPPEHTVVSILWCRFLRAFHLGNFDVAITPDLAGLCSCRNAGN